MANHSEFAGLKLIAVYMVVCSVLSACSSHSDEGVINRCGYSFSDVEMKNKFVALMGDPTEYRDLFSKDNGDFIVERKRCNYYTTFVGIPGKIDLKVLWVFDNDGNAIYSELFAYESLSDNK